MFILIVINIITSINIAINIIDFSVVDYIFIDIIAVILYNFTIFFVDLYEFSFILYYFFAQLKLQLLLLFNSIISKIHVSKCKTHNISFCIISISIICTISHLRRIKLFKPTKVKKFLSQRSQKKQKDLEKFYIENISEISRSKSIFIEYIRVQGT